MNNLENDFIRKQNSNDIISKDIKINRLLEQLKIRDEYISQEKKSLASKKIKFVFEQEKDIKKIPKKKRKKIKNRKKNQKTKNSQ